MNAIQIGMGFNSPAIESHTFPEHLGSWSNHHDHHAEIITIDERTLLVSARLSYPECSALVITIDGEVRVVKCPVSSDRFYFNGNVLASVISDLACGLYPRIWTEQEELFKQRSLTNDKRNKRERLQDIRDITKNMEARQQGNLND